MTKDNAVNLDTILQQLGPFGKYNIVNCALLLFPIYLAGMYGTVYVFEASDIEYKCNISECQNIHNYSIWIKYAVPKEKDELSKCKKYPLKEEIRDTFDGVCKAEVFDNTTTNDCVEFVYNDEDSIVKDFDLGCQNWKRTFIGSYHNAGLFISLPLTGIISDKYGRKLALIVASIMNGICGLFRSFSTSYEMMAVLEFLEAALGAGVSSTVCVLAMELVGPKERVFGITLISAVYVLGLMSLAGLSWWLQSWRQLLRVIYAPAFLVILYLWILNDSVRWLLSKDRHDEAKDILKKAAKMNKVELTKDMVIPLRKDRKEPGPEKDEKVERSPNLLQALKSRIMRQRVLVCSFLWITCTLVYYGLSINSVSLPGNKYVNFMLVGFAEIPANIVCFLVLDRFGRKRTIIISYVLSACLCISLSFLPKDEKWCSLILYLSGKFSITVSYSSVYIYVSELFPTSVRHSLLAVCSSIGRVGSTLAPLTPLLAVYYRNLPAIFFGSMALVASLLVFSLPETINTSLPDTIEDAERISRKNHKDDTPL